MKIGQKVLFGFAIITFIAIIIGILGLVNLNRIGREFHLLADNEMPKSEAIDALQYQLERIRVVQRTLLNPNLGREDQQRQWDNLADARRVYAEALELYDSLEKTEAEEREYRAMRQAMDRWASANAEFERIMQEVGRLDIHYPMEFLKDLEDFEGDHYHLQLQIMTAIQTRTLFEGGEDPTACALGRWLPELETRNSTINNNINSMRPHHDRFHHAVRDIKRDIEAGNYERALRRYNEEMLPAAEEVFKYFNVLITEAERAVDLFAQAEHQNMQVTIVVQNQTREHLYNLIHIIEENVEASVARGDGIIAFSNIFTVIILLIGIILAAGIGIFISTGIKNVLESLMGSVKHLVQSALDGKLDTRANPEEINFEFRDIVIGINDTLDAVIGPLNVAAEYVDRISKGDIPPKITDAYKGDFNEIKNNLNNCIDNLHTLIDDSQFLSKAAVEGKLDTRADASKHMNAFKEIVQGVNDTLDSVIGPLNVAAEYVDRISKGDIPPKITDAYKGDFNEIKNNLNLLIQSQNDITEIAKELSIGNTEVDIKERSSSDILVQSIIKMINNIQHDAEIAVEIGKGNLDVEIQVMSEKDAMAKSMMIMRDTLRNLDKEINALTNAAKEGKLDTRGNSSKFKGAYSEIVDGLNGILDAVIGPLNVAAEYVDRISKGDIPPKITDVYKGDFNEIKNNLNNCIDNLNALIGGVKDFAKYTNEGELSKINFDTRRYQGAYEEIFEGLNNVAKSILKPLNEAFTIIKKIADGDLSDEVRDNYQGLFNELKTYINNTVDSLNDLISQVTATVDQVSAGANQVNDASNALSQGATEQASSLEEVAASMQEIGSQTKQNAENANQAAQLATHAKDKAENGNQRMQELLGAMNDINESSKNISKIIKVIDEIAFQTNLLALNAAVEAARAGKHGKGFAVVAEEVRNLAARSAKAAKETAELIEGAVKNAEHGSDVAGKTAEILNEIETGSTKTTDIVSEIAAASNEQAQGISQINSGLNQIEQVTQQNTANAEETSAASEELTGQSSQLKDLIVKFKLKRQIARQSGNYQLSDRRSAKQLKPKNQDDMVQPTDVIKLDDDEFGRY